MRFGDVLVGFISTAPNIAKPLYPQPNVNDPFSIDVYLPRYCAIMDPCCQIGKKTILLTPLIPIPDQFWDSPYIIEDVSRINREGTHEKGFMHPEQWNKLSEEEKISALNSSPRYGLNNYFVYIGNEYLERYFVSKKNQYREVKDSVTNYPKFESCKAIIVKHKSLCHRF